MSTMVIIDLLHSYHIYSISIQISMSALVLHTTVIRKQDVRTQLEDFSVFAETATLEVALTATVGPQFHRMFINEIVLFLHAMVSCSLYEEEDG